MKNEGTWEYHLSTRHISLIRNVIKPRVPRLYGGNDAGRPITRLWEENEEPATN
ncbi:MAG: hypothetical protein ACTSUE_23085 [Promethearchaeota archaeon]